MNTEIKKFRAWNGVSFTYWTMNDLCTWGDKDEKPSAMDEWLQSTGIKDINGKDIYEGDVVKRMCFSKECDIEHKGKVVYEDNWGKYGIDDGLRDYSYLAPVAYGKSGSKMTLACEIVGNIYENPEMDIIYKKNE